MDNKNKVSRVGYILTVAFSVAALGAVTWLAIGKADIKSNFNKNTKSKSESNITTSEAPSVTESQNELQNTEVAKSVSDIPYSEPEVQEKAEFIMPIEGTIIKEYSATTLQISKTFGDMRLHTGIDIKCEEKTPVKAMADGTVTEVNDDSLWGGTVTIDHGNGITVKYCGIGSTALKKNDTVKSGDQIGVSANIPCECEDDMHIHIEVFNDGETISPSDLFN